MVKDSAPELLACPVAHRTDFTPCDAAELRPLLDFLRAGQPVAQRMDFPRGVLMPDGRLDLCKQDLGPANAEAVLEALAGYPHATHLLMGTNGIGDTGARAVARLLERGAHVRTVYLGCNLIGADGARELASAVRGHGAVEGLWLKRNPLGPEAGAIVSEALAPEAGLRGVDLVHTGLDAAGLRTLVDALLSRGTGVESLYLGGNPLDGACVPSLVALLRGHPRLRGLYLSPLALGDAAVVELARALADNRGLQVLGLASTGVGPAGARALAEALQGHPSLLHLDLGYARSTRVLKALPNDIGDEGVEAITAMLRANRVLRRVDLRRAGVTREGARRLIAALDGCTARVDLEVEGGLPSDVKPAWHAYQRRLEALGGHGSVVAPPPIRSVYR